MEQPGYHSVEEIEHSTDDDKQQCQLIITLKCIISSYAAGNKVATGYRIWYVLLHNYELWTLNINYFSFANTV